MEEGDIITFNDLKIFEYHMDGSWVKHLCTAPGTSFTPQNSVVCPFKELVPAVFLLPWVFSVNSPTYNAIFLAWLAFHMIHAHWVW